MPSKMLGIIGGIGPDATADIFKRIIDLTPATTDQEHIHIIVDNNPQVPSRVNAILHGGKSPLPAVAEMAVKLEAYGCDFLIIPCNTMTYYIEKIRKYVKIPILDIIEVTSDYLLKNKTRLNTVGLLGTEATVRLGLYQKCIIDHKLSLINDPKHTVIVDELVEKFKKRYYPELELELEDETRLVTKIHPEEEEKLAIASPVAQSLNKNVQHAIIDIKAGKYKGPKHQLIKAVKELEKNGAQAVIMGCTEIPLALDQSDVDIELIDPTQILAQAAVDFALRK